MGAGELGFKTSKGAGGGGPKHWIIFFTLPCLVNNGLFIGQLLPPPLLEVDPFA